MGRDETKMIFAYLYKGKFRAERLIENLDDDFMSMEYGDVHEGEYQVWQYPSGRIFKIESDREVLDNKYYYAPPAKNLWLPKLVEIGSDKAKVNEAYDLLKNPPKKYSIFKRLGQRLRGKGSF